MNKDMENKRHYQDMFDEVHASEDLLGKVKNMKNERISRKIGRVGKIAYIVVAIVLIVIVSSNAISYAATGSTWIEKVIISIGTQELEMDKYVDDNEIEYLEGDFKVDKKEVFVLDEDYYDSVEEFRDALEEYVEDEKKAHDEYMRAIDENATYEEREIPEEIYFRQIIRSKYTCEVEADGEKVYLIFKYTDIDGKEDNAKLKIKSKRVDITGKAKELEEQEKYYFMVEMGGFTYRYQLTKWGDDDFSCFLSSDSICLDDIDNLPLYIPFPEEEKNFEVIEEEGRVYLIGKNIEHYYDGKEYIIDGEQKKFDVTDQVKDGSCYFGYDFYTENALWLDLDEGESYGIVYKDKSGEYRVALSRYLWD